MGEGKVMAALLCADQSWRMIAWPRRKLSSLAYSLLKCRDTILFYCPHPPATRLPDTQVSLVWLFSPEPLAFVSYLKSSEALSCVPVTPPSLLWPRFLCLEPRFQGAELWPPTDSGACMVSALNTIVGNQKFPESPMFQNKK